MSRKNLRRFGGSRSPGNTGTEGAYGEVFTPEPIETSQPEMRNPQPTLPNPNPAPFDRKQPHSWQDRQRGLGFSVRPFNINELAPGDAGADLSQFRRGQFFIQLAGAGFNAVDLIWNIPIAMSTARSSDTRPRFFHVSFFNNGVIREPAGPVGPLDESQIQTASGQAPDIGMVRGRVQIQDESGGRFFDVDVLGTRSFSLYAFAVTTFILLPSTPDGIVRGSEVNRQAPEQPSLGPGIVEDSFASGRVVPIFQNATQITDNITRTATVPANTTNFIPIPPGTTRVQLSTSFSSTVLPPDLILAFSATPTVTAASALGRIFVIPGTTQTESVEVPNARFIVIIDSVANPSPRTWIATFTVEA